MKKSLIVLMFFVISTSVFAQNFAPIGAKWYYTSNGGGTVPPNAEYFYYKSIKDTIYYGVSCNKIERIHYKYQNGDSVLLNPLYVYSNNDTVFCYNNFYNSFKPIYIFNTIVNDTIRIFAEDSGSCRLVIDSIKMITINTEVLKKIFTHSLDNISFYNNGNAYMEKIGGLDWFFVRSLIIPEADGPLRCYEDSLIYTNFSSVTCDYRLISNIKDYTLFDNNIKLYPNPASTYLKIESKKLEVESFKIYDIFGRELARTKPNRFLNPVRVDISTLPKGIYFIKIRTKKGIIVKKFIKN